MKLFYTSLLLALPWAAQAQQSMVAPLPLDAVTVFFNSAELHHQSNLALPAGTSVVVLTGLSNQLQPRSLQIEVSENAEILSVDATPPGEQSSDVVAELEKELRRVRATLMALTEERAMVLANKQVPEVSSWTSELQRTADFFRQRLVEIQLRVDELQASQQTLITRLAAQRASGKPGAVAPVAAAGGVTVRLQLARAATVRLAATYLTDESYWQPMHDLRVSEGSRELRVVSKADIHNNSELDWRNARLTLQTADPQRSVARPNMQPWMLQRGGEEDLNEGRLDTYAVKGSSRGTSTAAGAADINELSTQYNLAATVSLAARSAQEVRLNEQKLPLRLEYMAVPKLSPDAYLVGKVVNWEQLNLVGDSASVYLGGAYVGKTELATRAYNDTLEISLGRDKQVLLSRAKREDVTSQGLLGGEKTRLGYEINVKNLHRTPIRVRVLDQLPLSADAEVAIKPIDISNAELDGPSGKLTWMINLAPGGSQKLPFSFSVEYPKSKRPNLRRRRRVMSPKFR
ncbi:DUF4139 domain-containing protein [Hymenobacter lucidus]|uniref:DUF4139 domain-containing protein n=1 Tax=Hymenobacter lucidus TaxID=2880930 RepID=A0ABS8AR60_9BACT|nr:DUF4139 domain-containing protein [Hymenobacter lucidus]MCB2408712.1 DUF4139 domain-containing protein [Hymenobacter lucidus]